MSFALNFKENYSNGFLSYTKFLRNPYFLWKIGRHITIKGIIGTLATRDSVPITPER